MSRGLGFVQLAWYRWKSLRLPWRKRFLSGFDLSGNTFWEFKDALNANRFRRIVQYKSHTTHYADVEISPQWHQWLRHARQQGPSIEEQKFELQRQAALKQLAAEADQRWRSQPSYLDHPIQTPDTDQSKGVGTDLQERGSEAKTYERDPGFSHERRIGAPSQYWQPKAWQPQRGPRDP